MKHAIFPCLWFQNEAKEAANYYCSIFNNARIIEENDFVSNFEVSGQKFMCLNGRHTFDFNASLSFFVVCETVEEIDYIWQRFKEDGHILTPIGKYDWSDQYGCIKDKYGVIWELAYGKLSDVGQKFTPVLTFVGDKLGKASEAIEHYTSIFKNSAVTGILRNEDGEDKDNVKHAQFSLDGNMFMMMDSSAHDTGFNESVSFVITCDSQEEIDYYWSRLSEGGSESMCGWLKDKFGVSWQVVPSILGTLINDPVKSPRVIEAFMKMRKFEIDQLLKA